MDQCTRTKNIPGPYFLQENETGIWELNYDLGDGGIGRIDNIKEIGWTDRYIFTKNDFYYHFIDKDRDSMFYNAQDIVVGPLDSLTFLKFLDSLRIDDLRMKKL
jgi:hypothetical protein